MLLLKSENLYKHLSANLPIRNALLFTLCVYFPTALSRDVNCVINKCAIQNARDVGSLWI